MSDLILPEPPRRVTVKAKIISAKYHPLEKQVAVLVRLPNGNPMSHVIPANCYLFEGQPADKTHPEIIDEEMEKVAALFRQAKNRSIKIEVEEEKIS
jgi:hypothetical protein